ncbi:MAG: alpha-L-fucosidase [Odoribacter sp.]|nr:alpha-L-fucosidase [Odoribacter sp.]
MNKFITLLLAATVCFSCNRGKAPAPYGPLPSQGQLNWHALETYAFVHFNMNTFTGREWGMGNEKPEWFNPTELDCRQWVKAFKDAGMKGVIITAKHHDGFCLWPTSTTEHSVKHSPWKNGQGDVVRELSDACREAGLKFGVYLSPWDRNNAHYGKPEYIQIFREQLKELLTQYGEVFEVWFDGANGGNGYYGGANETRSVDRQKYYDWPTTFAIVSQLQPNAVIFSDGGPGVRWVGNERGYAGETNWSLLRRDEFWPGSPNSRQLISGHEDGTHWLPAEVDVSIRPGWYYHASQDSQIKSLPQLMDIYYHSVGRNASLLLNVPAAPNGRITDADVKRLQEFKASLDADFKTNLTPKAIATSNKDRGTGYNAAKTLDNDNNTYWGAPDSSRNGVLTFHFEQPVTINRILIQEPIFMGQRVQQFSVEALVDGSWKSIVHATTIGYKRILRTENFTTKELRINIEKAKACPLISNVEFYCAPESLTQPQIFRNKKGEVTIQTKDKNVDIHYTTDGSYPDSLSSRYTRPFFLAQATVKAVAVDKANRRSGPVTTVRFDVAKTNWTIPGEPDNITAIDDDPETFYTLKGRKELIIDLGKEYGLKGFTYLPEANTPILEYEFYVSRDGKKWGKPVSAGEFSNIVNSPVLQKKTFPETTGRFIRLKARKTHGSSGLVRIAEISIVTQK